MHGKTEQRPQASGEMSKTPAYAWYALAVMLVLYVFAFIDRQMLNLLVEPIKHDLLLSDFEISLLQGFAFAVFLSLSGLPLGRLIDTGRRTAILAAGGIIWSLATAACGLSGSFGQLLMARIGVSLGESAMTPSALSLIGDYFPPRRMGLATSLYALGVHVGSGLALILGALVVAHLAQATISLPVIGAARAWQIVFIAVGLSGIVAALWVASLKEPLRGCFRQHPMGRLSLGEVFALLRANGAALHCANLGVAFAAMATYAISAWLPSFFVRHFHWTPAHIGSLYGPVIIVSGIAGVMSAGLGGDWLHTRGAIDGRFRIMSGAALAALPFVALAPNMEDPLLALALFGVANYFLAAAIGSGPALLQDMTPAHMRGVTHALAVLTVNLIAIGLGPSSIAIFTDFVLHDERKVGLSLSIVTPMLLLLSSGIAFAGRKPFLKAMDRFKKL